MKDKLCPTQIGFADGLIVTETGTLGVIVTVTEPFISLWQPVELLVPLMV